MPISNYPYSLGKHALTMHRLHGKHKGLTICGRHSRSTRDNSALLPFFHGFETNLEIGTTNQIIRLDHNGDYEHHCNLLLYWLSFVIVQYNTEWCDVSKFD